MVPELIWPTEAVTHMWDKHRTTVAMAVEALNDPDVVAFIPDPKSRSGKSSRFIGFSPPPTVCSSSTTAAGDTARTAGPPTPPTSASTAKGTPSERRTQ